VSTDVSADRAVERLRALDACAVSDALDALGLAGAVTGISRRTAPKLVVGRAVTVKVVPRRDATPAPHLATEAVQTAQPGDVIVVDNGGRTDVSAWGGLLSLAAQRRGVAGVIVDGACRDYDEAAELDFAVYSRATVTVTARGRIVQQSFNTPVSVGPVQVHPGDLVIADGSGVVFVQAAEAERVLELAEQISARESAMADAIRAGESLVDVMHDERFTSGRTPS
jgi:regulator of RNase E activity RraA